MNKSLRPVVRKGIKFLNEREPGWRKRIDLNTLDVANCAKCVLGQLYGEYGTGVHKLFPELGREFNYLGGVLGEHGFTTQASADCHRMILNGDRDRWDRLTAAWRTELAPRKHRVKP